MMVVVEIYTSPSCGYCHRAKLLLKQKSLNFKEYDIVSNKKHQDDMVRRAKGRKTVPQIFIDNKHIGGCDDLFSLELDGTIDLLLGHKNSTQPNQQGNNV